MKAHVVTKEKWINGHVLMDRDSEIGSVVACCDSVKKYGELNSCILSDDWEIQVTITDPDDIETFCREYNT